MTSTGGHCPQVLYYLLHCSHRWVTIKMPLFCYIQVSSRIPWGPPAHLRLRCPGSQELSFCSLYFTPNDKMLSAPRYTPKWTESWKQGFKEILDTNMQSSPRHIKRCNQPKCPSMGEWMDKMYTYTHMHGVLFSPRKEGKSDTCYMDEPRGPHAKWNKSITERQRVHESTYGRT